MHIKPCQPVRHITFPVYFNIDIPIRLLVATEVTFLATATRASAIKLPSFSVNRTDIVIKSPQLPKIQENELLGKEVPFFLLPTTSVGGFGVTSLRGTSSIISFVNTWSPSGVEQISILDESVSGGKYNQVFVSNQEDPARVKIFKSKGRYKSEIVIDRDGELSAQYNSTTIPTHFFLDNRGVVEKIVTGVLNEDEVKEIVTSL